MFKNQIINNEPENRFHWVFCEWVEEPLVFKIPSTAHSLFFTSYEYRIQFDTYQYNFELSDCIHAQICIIKNENKYGIYTLDKCNGFGGPGVFINPSRDPFPYDDFSINVLKDGLCYVIFKIADNWGVEEIADTHLIEEPIGAFCYEYAMTRRRIVIPCVNTTCELARSIYLQSKNLNERV